MIGRYGNRRGRVGGQSLLDLPNLLPRNDISNPVAPPLPSARQSALQEVLRPEDLPPDRKFEPTVTVFIGRRGRGKTLAMTAFAKIMQARYKKFGNPFGVLSNYKMDFADGVHPFLVDEMGQFPKWGRRFLMCIDELATAAMNRRSMSASNIDLSQFLTQIRKRDVEILGTTQFPRVLDLQVLLQIDLFVHCELVAGGRGVRLLIYDLWGQYKVGAGHRKPELPGPNRYDWCKILWNTDTLFGTYNTNEVIPAIWKGAIRTRILEEQGHEITREEEEEVALGTA